MTGLEFEIEVELEAGRFLEIFDDRQRVFE